MCSSVDFKYLILTVGLLKRQIFIGNSIESPQNFHHMLLNWNHTIFSGGSWDSVKYLFAWYYISLGKSFNSVDVSIFNILYPNKAPWNKNEWNETASCQLNNLSVWKQPWKKKPQSLSAPRYWSVHSPSTGLCCVNIASKGFWGHNPNYGR